MPSRRSRAAADPRWSPNGTELTFLRPTAPAACSSSSSNVDGSNPRVLLEPDSALPFMREPAWAPDGREIAIVRGSGGVAGEIWLVPVEGGSAAAGDGGPAGSVLSLAGLHGRRSRHRALVQPRRRDQHLVLSAGAAARRCASRQAPDPDMSPTVAADGTIAFINSRWRNTLDIFSLRGAAPRVLTYTFPVSVGTGLLA